MTNTLTDPHWMTAPSERDPGYFWAWQHVSLALQRWLRDQVAEAYFENPTQFENRTAAYPMIVYQASRLCHGHPRTEFTYDLRDYPECRTTLMMSWKLTGRAIQAALGRIEQRLLEAGMAELAHRYAPVWHQDVLVAVQKKPKPYVDLLMAESTVINAAIDLGTERSVEAAIRFRKVFHLNFRKIHGMDLQSLGAGLLEEATRVLSERPMGRGGDLGNAGAIQNSNVTGDGLAAGGPHMRISVEEDGDDGRADSGRQMRDAGVVADVQARRRDPAGQLV